jgi:7 transmembrane sweet-taste receptor of 3 GCPR/Receptor family ligand binding region
MGVYRRDPWGTIWALYVALQFVLAKTGEPPTKITIAGLFNAFNYKADGTLIKNEDESQHFAAFMMAVDEINQQTAGVYNNLLIEMALIPGQKYLQSYPSNPYFDGSASAYEVYMAYPSVVGSVVTNSILPQAAASASCMNSFGSVTALSASSASTLNDAHEFPMTLQIPSSTSAEATKLSALISKQNWKNIILISTTDVVGIDSYASFLFGFPDITVAKAIFISFDTPDLTSQIGDAKATGATIFVLFLDGRTAGQLLEQGYNAGLFHDGTQVLATSTTNIKDIRAAFTPAGLLNEAKILKGFITTAPHPEYYFSTPLGQAFISRFRNLPPSMRVDPSSGTRSCNTRSIVYPNGSYTARDNENTERFRNITTELCLGFESFKSFNANGTNIDPSILYTYDSVYMYVTAASNLIMQKRPINAASLYDYMTSSLFTSLVTGYAFFIPGRGTRAVGNVFKVLNYQPSAPDNEYSGNGLAYIGEFTDATGWLLCGNTQDMSKMPSTSGSQCTPPVYRMIPETSQPLDAPPVRIEQLPSNVRISLIVLASFGLMTLAVWGTCLCAFWRRKIIRTAQPQIMVFLLIGGVMGLVKVLLSAADVTNETCLSQMWLSHFAFRLIFRTLLLKLWRINGVVNAARFKRIIIPESTVLWYLLSDLVFMTFALLIPITIISSLKNGMVGYVSSTVANQVTLYIECQVSLSLDLQILNAILYFSDGLNLIMAVYYTYLTRTVPVNVNETSTVAPGELELESESSP